MSAVAKTSPALRVSRRALHRSLPVHFVAILTSVICAGPVLLVVWASVRTRPFEDISLFGDVWSFDAITNLLSQDNVLRWIFNSLFVALTVTALTVVIDLLAAYAYAKLRFPGRKSSFVLLLSTLMLPFSVTIIPVYMIVVKAGLSDTYAGIILPSLAAPFGVFLLRQFIDAIPDSLLEAARIDGAGTQRTFWQIVLPLCVQPMGVLAIFTFVASWNGFLWPLLITQSTEMRTLPVGIASTNTQFVQNLEGMTAAAVVSLIPMVILFLAFQKYFIKGALAGAIRE